MFRPPAGTVALIAAVLFGAGVAPGLRAETSYSVSLKDGASGWLHVETQAECPPPECMFELPVWNATYQVRDFAQYVSGLEARDGAGVRLGVRKTSPSRWAVRSGQGDVTIAYRVLANRSGPFGAYVDAGQATLNLGQVLIYPLSGRNEPMSLRFVDVPRGVRQALSLDPSPTGGYSASSYDRLIDTPVHLSAFDEQTVRVGGKRIRVVVAGGGTAQKLETLTRTARRIVEAGRVLMEELPFDSYLFVYVFSDEDGGGMEYRNGTVIFGPRECRGCGLPSLTAHEFFHVWNVKRIRPASMEPVDFSRPMPSPSLWFSEGVTSTYAQYLQIMAGLGSGGGLEAHLERLINTYEARPAARTQSAEEAGVDAWLERYPFYGRADRSVSYYLKGELVGHLLDLTIRERSDNRRSLDDVMRRLNEEYARKGRFYEDTDALERLCSEAAGADLSDLFDELVRQPAGIDWDAYLSQAGLGVEIEERRRVESGMTLSNPPGRGVVVNHVEADGPAAKGGLRSGDSVFKINGRRVTGGSYEAMQRLERMAGRTVKIIVERSDQYVSLEIEPRAGKRKHYRIVQQNEASDRQHRVREGWRNRTISTADESPSSQ